MTNAEELIKKAEKEISIFERPSVTTSMNLMRELEIYMDKLKLIESKFKSGNSVPIERITIIRKEWFGEGW